MPRLEGRAQALLGAREQPRPAPATTSALDQQQQPVVDERDQHGAERDRERLRSADEDLDGRVHRPWTAPGVVRWSSVKSATTIQGIPIPNSTRPAQHDASACPLVESVTPTETDHASRARQRDPRRLAARARRRSGRRATAPIPCTVISTPTNAASRPRPVPATSNVSVSEKPITRSAAAQATVIWRSGTTCRRWRAPAASSRDARWPVARRGRRLGDPHACERRRPRARTWRRRAVPRPLRRRR